MSVVAILAGLLAAFLLAVLGYRWLFTLAALLRAAPASDAPRPGAAEPSRFAVLIPAHDEALLVGQTVDSIRKADYPGDRIRPIVVADNCSDDTAAVAHSHGAEVRVRTDPEARGKGQALAWALGALPLEDYDAIAFVDADNLVDPGFFRAMDAALAGGARVLQGYDGLSNPGESTLTRLMAVTSVMKNLLFYGGKSALGWSSLLMGTGMVMTPAVLREVGWSAMSIGEDLEQSLVLRERGERIRFVPEARVYAQEATSLRQGYVQRQRWASGRQAVKSRALRALREGVAGGNPDLVDAGVELLLPTYSMTVNLTLLAGLLGAIALPVSGWPLLMACAALALEIAEGAVALRVMRADAEFVRSLLFAPVFLAWKAGIDVLATFGYRRDRWTRTERGAPGTRTEERR